MLEVLRIAFDIGGVISRYPGEMKTLMQRLINGGAYVFLLTDMNRADAHAACRENKLYNFIGHRGLIGSGINGAGTEDLREQYILCANWSDYGDQCKTRLMEMNKINFLIDDRPDYCAEGDYIGLVLSPRQHIPYYHNSWINKSTPAVMVPPEEYEEFKAWKEANGPQG